MTEWKRNCPKCNNIIYYKNQFCLNRSKRKNNACRKCNLCRKSVYEKWIKKFGKDIADKKMLEYSKKMSDACRGEKNGFYGKTFSKAIKYKVGSAHRGKKQSIESNKKRRLTLIKRIEENKLNGGQMHPGFNRNACEVIDWINKFYGYNFKHALNGGEFYIKNLGYWTDGYDKDKNFVIEYYEKRHYNESNNLKERDMNREKEIIEYLNCEFIRINAFDKNNLILEKIN